VQRSKKRPWDREAGEQGRGKKYARWNDRSKKRVRKTEFGSLKTRGAYGRGLTKKRQIRGGCRGRHQGITLLKHSKGLSRWTWGVKLCGWTLFKKNARGRQHLAEFLEGSELENEDGGSQTSVRKEQENLKERKDADPRKWCSVVSQKGGS